MEIRIRETGQTMYESEFRAYTLANGGPTWEMTTTEVLDSLGADVLLEGPTPTATEYQVVSRDGAEQIDGNWYTKYKVTDMDQEGIDAVNANKTKSIGQQAQQLLSSTDWTTIPSVADPEQSNPYLTNQAEFIAWRSQVRAIAITPAWDSVIPAQPKNTWSK